jgi:hypothetical protein
MQMTLGESILRYFLKYWNLSHEFLKFGYHSAGVLLFFINFWVIVISMLLFLYYVSSIRTTSFVYMAYLTRSNMHTNSLETSTEKCRQTMVISDSILWE